LCDISPVALELAERRARAAGLPLRTCECDLELACDPTYRQDTAGATLPAGPWDLILSVLYLHRPLLPMLVGQLAAGGTLVVIQPTRTNLERRAKPPAEYLLEDGELPRLAEGLEVLHYEEGWLADGRHDAVLVARKPPAADPADRLLTPTPPAGDRDRTEEQAG
ncbi:MAG: class I SAM-dependent methyltransferase, partial [Pirellulaceae bacterium]|nr:class I SAM-dependent methyltransferase [Pirellulaceae bacterium]